MYQMTLIGVPLYQMTWSSAPRKVPNDVVWRTMYQMTMYDVLTYKMKWHCLVYLCTKRRSLTYLCTQQMTLFDVPMYQMTLYDVPMNQMTFYDVLMHQMTLYDVPMYQKNDDVWRTFVPKNDDVWRTYVPNDVLHRPGRDLGAETVLVLSVAGDIRVGHADGTGGHHHSIFHQQKIHCKRTVYPDLGIWNF